MTGAKLREFRRDQNWTNGQLAQMLGISKWQLQEIETSRRLAPTEITDRIETLVRGLNAGAVKSDRDKPRRQYRDFRRSTNFSETPPFLILPGCPCMDKRCRLTPKGDGDWDGKHLWKFMGRRCTKIYYVDQSGGIAPRPVRHSPPSSPLGDFHRSASFSVVPPFETLPRCPCGNMRCRLLPCKDRDVDGQHFWVFEGWKCQRVSYVDNQGVIVPIPRGYRRDPRLRDPLLQKRCSVCGRVRFLNRQYRATLGCYVAQLYCVPKAGDAPDQQHDPTELFRDENGKIIPLTAEDRDKLRRRSKQEFTVPLCEVGGCPRRGKRMERSSELSANDTSGKSWKLLKYYCRPGKRARPHQAYRVAPHGEIARRISMGHYRWTDC
jgi:hypothetical protein